MANTDLAEDLEAARASIANKRDWGQGDGDKGSGIPRGGRRCAAMAIADVATCQTARWHDAVASICRLLPPSPTPGRPVGALVEFNDTHTHAEVLALFDRAIASARQPKEPQP